MTSSALIAHILDPLIDPEYAEQDMLYEKTFEKQFGSGDDHVTRDYLRGLKRVAVECMDWAGDKLLIASKDSALRLMDVEHGVEERQWAGDWMCMQCDPNAPHTAAAVSWSGKFRVFDTRSSSSHIFDVDLTGTSPAMKEFLSLCWSPDSQYIAVSNRSDQVYLLDLRDRSKLRLGAHRSLPVEVNQMVWSQDGRGLWIATGGTPGRICTFPTPSLQTEGSTALAAHQYAVISLATDPTGKYIASGGGDCLVTLWDPRHHICTRAFGFATQAVTTLSFNHSGSLLAWGTGASTSSAGERNLTIVGANSGSLYWTDVTPAPVQHVRWHSKRNVLAYALNPAMLPEERENVRDRRGEFGRSSGRENAVVHTLKVPEI